MATEILLQPKYVSEEGLWRAIDDKRRYEIILAGDKLAPNRQDLERAERILPNLKALSNVASEYLNHFVDQSEFTSEDDWYLEGASFGLDAVREPDSFCLDFTHSGDIYSMWGVLFRERINLSEDAMIPVCFFRQQS